MLLRWLDYLRGAVLRNIEGLTDEQARWTPDGALISVLGVVNHLTHVEWRWIDGGIHGRRRQPQRGGVPAGRRAHRGGRSRGLPRTRAGHERERAASSLTAPCRLEENTDLRWVLLHLINETARHCGHADATRELLDGTTGK